jgi:hypothetical protein
MAFIASTLTFNTGLSDWFNRVFKKMQPYGYTRAAIEMEREGYLEEAAALRQMAKFAGE